MTKIIALSIVVLLSIFTVPAQQTTSFSYQGKLNSSSLPANGVYDFRFELHKTLTEPNLVGTVNINGVQVTNGIFTVQLDFGEAFDGLNKFLDISVKLASDSTYTRLTPRQPIASAPYSTRAISSQTAVNAQTANYATNAGNAVNAAEALTANFAGDAGSLGGIAANNYLQKTGDGSQLTNVNAVNADKLGGSAANTYLKVNGNGSQLTNLNGANITNSSITSSALAPNVTVHANTKYVLIGALRWDLLKPQNYNLPSIPNGFAFDGANLWITLPQNNTVMKFRPSDGVNLGTFPTGNGPSKVAFDGANIWIVNYLGNSLTKLRASDGANLGTFAVGNSPTNVAFDGSNIWVTLLNSSNNSSVIKLNPSTGDFVSFPVGSGPFGLAFDGTNIWVSNFYGNTLTKIRAADGVNLGTFSVGQQPQAVVFDGLNIWVLHISGFNAGYVSKIRPSDGTNLGTISAGFSPTAICFDGNNIWVTSEFDDNITKFRASDSANLGSFAIRDSPQFIAFDGANIWVASTNSQTITKMTVFP